MQLLKGTFYVLHYRPFLFLRTHRINGLIAILLYRLTPTLYRVKPQGPSCTPTIF